MQALKNITIGQAIKEAVEKHGMSLSLIYGGTGWSYLELDQFSDILAAGLLASGVRRGDHVAIWAELEPHTVLSFYAIQKIGAVAVMLGTDIQKNELLAQLRLSDAKYLLISDGYKDVSFPEVCRSAPELQELKQIFFIGQGKSFGYASIRSLMAAGQSISQDMLTAAKNAVQPQDTSTILFTSGTTGPSKAVMTSHYACINNAAILARYLRATKNDRFCAVLPMHHCFGLVSNILAALTVGACVYLPENRKINTILHAFHRERCTILNAVPNVFNALIARKDLSDFDLSSMRTGIIGGALYTPRQFCDIENVLGIKLLSSLGLTEATAGITICNPDNDIRVRSGTLGHFMDHMEGKIADIRSGANLPPGSVGEICVRGYSVMQGYYKDPENTAEAVRENGWLHTGDMGWIDDEGNLHFTGRIKEIIIRGGENINPSEIEALIMTHENVYDVKVIGIPDKHCGEELCACVVLKSKADTTEDEMRSFLSKSLAPFKIPGYVLFLDSLPYTSTGKVNKSELRSQALEALAGKLN